MTEETLENTAETRQVESLRAGTWSLLGRLLLAPPDAQMRSRLVEIGASGQAGDAVGEAWERLSEAAGRARDEALDAEYGELFIGVGGGQITPYSSWYLRGMLADRPLVDLRTDLESLGIAMREGCSETEDHAGAICEIMAHVIVDDDVDLDWQKDIFDRHVDSWMGRLFEDLAKAPSAEFYRAVAALGDAFLKLERKFYAMSV